MIILLIYGEIKLFRTDYPFKGWNYNCHQHLVMLWTKTKKDAHTLILSLAGFIRAKREGCTSKLSSLKGLWNLWKSPNEC